LRDPRLQSLVFPLIVPATIATAAAVTYTAAQVLGGLILRDPGGAARSDVLPTASDLCDQIQGAMVGTSFVFTIRNTSAGAFTITVTAGTGGTVSGTATIAQNNTKSFLVVFTNVTPGTEAFTIYSLGTVTT
jgi:hypothetical protein